jgi:hypothetical protein
MTGQVVFSQKVETHNAQINTSDFTAGIYNLKITCGEQVINRKVVVK